MTDEELTKLIPSQDLKEFTVNSIAFRNAISSILRLKENIRSTQLAMEDLEKALQGIKS